jgi:hypothetical protein
MRTKMWANLHRQRPDHPIPEGRPRFGRTNNLTSTTAPAPCPLPLANLVRTYWVPVWNVVHYTIIGWCNPIILNLQRPSAKRKISHIFTSCNAEQSVQDLNFSSWTQQWKSRPYQRKSHSRNPSNSKLYWRRETVSLVSCNQCHGKDLWMSSEPRHSTAKRQRQRNQQMMSLKE